jgi:hypothetical protein
VLLLFSGRHEKVPFARWPGLNFFAGWKLFAERQTGCPALSMSTSLRDQPDCSRIDKNSAVESFTPRDRRNITIFEHRIFAVTRMQLLPQ